MAALNAPECLLHQFYSDPAIATPLVLDLHDADRSRLRRIGQMRAAAGLPVQVADLDDSHGAVGGRRGRHREAADQTLRRLRFRCADVIGSHIHGAADHLVDRFLQQAQRVVVRFGQIEIHPGSAVGIDLRAGHERPGEALIDESVKNMRGGMKLGDGGTPGRVDGHVHGAIQFERLVEQMPQHAAFRRHAGNVRDALRVRQHRRVRHLAAAARMQGRAPQHDRAGARGDHARFEFEQVRLLMAKIVRHLEVPAGND
ncbi:hypothetical protein KCU90_g1562, partial [Aureobasidium melanogenum]